MSECGGSPGYQWWDIRVELDTIDGTQICANTFGTFMLLVNKKNYFAPSLGHLAPRSPTDTGVVDGAMVEQDLTDYPGDALELSDEPTEVVVLVHKSDAGSTHEGGNIENTTGGSSEKKRAPNKSDKKKNKRQQRKVEEQDVTTFANPLGNGDGE